MIVGYRLLCASSVTIKRQVIVAVSYPTNGTSIGLCRVNPEVVLVQQVFILTRNRPLNGVKVYVHDTREECNLPIKCYLTQMQGTKVLHSSCRESTETQSDATESTSKQSLFNSHIQPSVAKKGHV